MDLSVIGLNEPRGEDGNSRVDSIVDVEPVSGRATIGLGLTVARTLRIGQTIARDTQKSRRSLDSRAALQINSVIDDLGVTLKPGHQTGFKVTCSGCPSRPNPLLLQWQKGTSLQAFDLGAPILHFATYAIRLSISEVHSEVHMSKDFVISPTSRFRACEITHFEFCELKTLEFAQCENFAFFVTVTLVRADAPRPGQREEGDFHVSSPENACGCSLVDNFAGMWPRHQPRGRLRGPTPQNDMLNDGSYSAYRFGGPRARCTRNSLGSRMI